MQAFKSKIDGWFWFLIFATALILLGGAWSVSTRYFVDSERLRIRSGPFVWNVERSEIKGIEATRSVLSAPALSLDRLRIRYGVGREILVSPADKDRFVAALGMTLTN